jgi:uncharacterized protein YndB with AHSA1/START domain
VVEIRAESRSAAPPERVFELLANVSSWPSWADFESAEVEQGAGVGELRALRRGRRVTRERVTALEPPRRLAYELVSGLPLRDYSAEVRLDPDGDGTRVTWRSTFRPQLPGTGWLIKRRLGAFVRDTADGVAREAERRSQR